jgi:predicted nucleic acid-binding protein
VTFLLDTSAISALLREDPSFSRWLASIRPEDEVVTCAIVRGEILFGLARLAEGRRRIDLEAKASAVLAALRCEPVTPVAASFYATLKAEQQRRGLSLDENDLWIAATALALSATLISRDSDFQRIDGLTLISP